MLLQAYKHINKQTHLMPMCLVLFCLMKIQIGLKRCNECDVDSVLENCLICHTMTKSLIITPQVARKTVQAVL